MYCVLNKLYLKVYSWCHNVFNLFHFHSGGKPVEMLVVEFGQRSSSSFHFEEYYSRNKIDSVYL